MMSFEVFLVALGSVLEEKSIMFHSKNLKPALAAMQFFTLVIKPLAWPYPLVPRVLPKNYELMRSPFPIIGCIRDDILYVMNNWNSTIEPNLVHIDVENNFFRGGPKHPLEKLFKHSKQLETLKVDFESLRVELTEESEVETDTPTGMRAIELVNIIRQMLSEIYMFESKDVAAAPNKRAAVLKYSKVDQEALKTYTNTQMFINFHGTKN